GGDRRTARVRAPVPSDGAPASKESPRSWRRSRGTGRIAFSAAQAGSPSRPASARRNRLPSGSGFQLKSSGPCTPSPPEPPRTPSAWSLRSSRESLPYTSVGSPPASTTKAPWIRPSRTSPPARTRVSKRYRAPSRSRRASEVAIFVTDAGWTATSAAWLASTVPSPASANTPWPSPTRVRAAVCSGGSDAVSPAPAAPPPATRPTRATASLTIRGQGSGGGPRPATGRARARRDDFRYARTDIVAMGLQHRVLMMLLMGGSGLAVAAAAGASLPSAQASAPGPDGVTVAIATLLNGPEVLVVDGQRLDARALRQLYEPRGYRPVWAGGEDASERASEIADALAHASAHGLEPATYHQQAIARRASDPKPAGRASLDVLASDGLIRLIEHLRTGAVRPESLGGDIAVESRPVDAQALVLEAAAATDLSAFLDGLAPQTET